MFLVRNHLNLDFLKFECIFSIWDSNTYFFTIILLFKWLYGCFIERGIQNFILKFREIFLWRNTVLRAHGMKSDEKPFFCQIYAIFCHFEGKMVHVVIDRYFSLFLKGFKIFLITDCPFKFKFVVVASCCNVMYTGTL